MSPAHDGADPSGPRPPRQPPTGRETEWLSLADDRRCHRPKPKVHRGQRHEHRRLQIDAREPRDPAESSRQHADDVKPRAVPPRRPASKTIGRCRPAAWHLGGGAGRSRWPADRLLGDRIGTLAVETPLRAAVEHDPPRPRSTRVIRGRRCRRSSRRAGRTVRPVFRGGSDCRDVLTAGGITSGWHESRGEHRGTKTACGCLHFLLLLLVVPLTLGRDNKTAADDHAQLNKAPDVRRIDRC